jgi:DNA mismatch repair ATPase MutS
MAKTVDKYLGKVTALASILKYRVELTNIKYQSKTVEDIDIGTLQELNIRIQDPYFEMTEITNYELVPKEFGGMETQITRHREYVKISCIEQEVKNKRAKIAKLEEEVKELQGKCDHRFDVIKNGVVDECGYYYIDYYWRYIKCKYCDLGKYQKKYPDEGYNYTEWQDQ